MLSESGNNKVLAARGEGDDPNTPVFRALDPGYQALREETLHSDTDRAWGQIDDRADRIDGQSPLCSRTSSTPKSERPSPVSSIPAAAYLVRARIAFIITSQTWSVS